MTKVMYEVPSDPRIRRVIITEECIRNGTDPKIVRHAARPKEKDDGLLPA